LESRHQKIAISTDDEVASLFGLDPNYGSSLRLKQRSRLTLLSGLVEGSGMISNFVNDLQQLPDLARECCAKAASVEFLVPR